MTDRPFSLHDVEAAFRASGAGGFVAMSADALGLKSADSRTLGVLVTADMKVWIFVCTDAQAAESSRVKAWIPRGGTRRALTFLRKSNVGVWFVPLKRTLVDDALARLG
jgi:hypothetical protein